MRNYWLMKSEPSEVSVDDALAAPHATVPWTGVRNYQARNFMRDAMRVGDRKSTRLNSSHRNTSRMPSSA